MQVQQVAERHMEAARSAAREEQLRDSDSFADWLSGCCLRMPVSRVFPKLSLAALVGYMDRGATEAELLTIALDPGQAAQVRAHAMDALADRYCATPTVAGLIEEDAAQRAPVIAEDERDSYRAAA